MVLYDVELSICIALTALKKFDYIISIDTDTSASYKCGHCGWVGEETVPRILFRARLKIRCRVLDPEGARWEDNPRKLSWW